MRRRPEAAAARLAGVDWPQAAASLDERGYATTAALLTSEQCRGLAALYEQEEAFRSRVVMQRHGFGRGEYKYLRYPLPEIVEALRQAIYPQLAPIAGANGFARQGGSRRRSVRIWMSAIEPARSGRRRCC